MLRKALYVLAGLSLCCLLPACGDDDEDNGNDVPAPVISTGPFGGGAGTEADPYQIKTIAHLNNIRNNDGGENYLDDHFILMNDLDFNGYTYEDNAKGWLPIGQVIPDDDGYLQGTPFSGSFNGNGKKISKLRIARGADGDAEDADDDSDQIGLFGVVAGGINSAGDDLTAGGKVENLGLEDVNITGNNNVGALVGVSIGTISKCYSTGTVSNTDDDVGGLVGTNFGTISKCYSTGTVSGVGDVGGLVGENRKGTIENSYAAGDVSASGMGGGTGGLVGENDEGTITNCYSTGAVSASGTGSEVGGLVGNNLSGSTITNSYATGEVSASETSARVGGLLGRNSGSFEDTPEGMVTNSYWNTETSDQSEGIDVDNGTATGVEGYTTAEMRMQGSYVSWDFTMIWNAPSASSFPTLRGVEGQ